MSSLTIALIVGYFLFGIIGRIIGNHFGIMVGSYQVYASGSFLRQERINKIGETIAAVIGGLFYFLMILLFLLLKRSG